VKERLLAKARLQAESSRHQRFRCPLSRNRTRQALSARKL